MSGNRAERISEPMSETEWASAATSTGLVVGVFNGEIADGAASAKDGRKPLFEEVAQELAQLTALPPNWDSYGARRIPTTVVKYAFEYLQRVMPPNMPKPTVVPTSQGGVQFEWHTMAGDVEIQIVTPLRPSASFEPVDGEMQEWSPALDSTVVRDALKSIADHD